MSIASTVVEIRDGSGETVLGRLAAMHEVNIYGIKENKIVAVVEGATLKIVGEAIKALARLDEVVSVYPVYLTDQDGRA